MSLLSLLNIRTQEVSDPAVVGTLIAGIGNTTYGHAVYLTGSERAIEVAPAAYLYKLLAADGLVKGSAGVLHSITLTAGDAAATAGTIKLYDGDTEAGPVILNHTVAAAAFAPVTLILDVEFTNGLYVGFDTVADVNVTVAYR